MEIVCIYYAYGFSGAIVNFKVWISHFFPSVSCTEALAGVLSFLKIPYIFTEARLINAECFSLCRYSFFITLIAVRLHILARICY